MASQKIEIEIAPSDDEQVIDNETGEIIEAVENLEEQHEEIREEINEVKEENEKWQKNLSKFLSPMLTTLTDSLAEVRTGLSEIRDRLTQQEQMMSSALPVSTPPLNTPETETEISSEIKTEPLPESEDVNPVEEAAEQVEDQIQSARRRIVKI